MHSESPCVSSPLAAARALRRLQRGRAKRLPVLRSHADGQLLAVIDPRTRRVYSRQPVEVLVDALATGHSGFGELEPSSSERQAGGGRLAAESLDRLCWRFGKRLADDTGLGTWIDPARRYSLARWPEFSQIGTEPEGALLCAILAQRPLDVAAMVEASKLPHDMVYRLLNSLSLCGCLVAEPRQSACMKSATAQAEAPRQPSLFDSLWQRLGGR
jgi:hypothetical protein